MSSNRSLIRCEFPILFAHFLNFDARSAKILRAALHIITKAARIISRQNNALISSAVEISSLRWIAIHLKERSWT
jgi:hypothetical protein